MNWFAKSERAAECVVRWITEERQVVGNRSTVLRNLFLQMCLLAGTLLA